MIRALTLAACLATLAPSVPGLAAESVVETRVASRLDAQLQRLLHRIATRRNHVVLVGVIARAGGAARAR